MAMRKRTDCSCGSRMPRRELKDAAGIFCTFVCDACEAKKKKAFKSYIFREGTRYAQTGNEKHIPVAEIKSQIDITPLGRKDSE